MNKEAYTCRNCGEIRSYIEDGDRCGNCGKPTPPMPHLLKEGSYKTCECGSSIKTTWLGFKELGCINPRCKNYYKRNE